MGGKPIVAAAVHQTFELEEQHFQIELLSLAAVGGKVVTKVVREGLVEVYRDLTG
ncbi:hypothetical protein RGB73_26845 [Brevibacillus brevis]|uniref:Uncharacterized protein n=1 Tax=Brevibacillus brevis TaxID=1393 RepID=A0ABY9T2C4_BREBE|nr:hypothetical protein [Brevibacillus brevis]WNC14257.1 hypothetical protein RGB73_26845 [Brevibacillus brevis]